MSGTVLEGAGAIDIAEAADRLGISLATLETILEHGFLKGFQGEDGRWKVFLERSGLRPRVAQGVGTMGARSTGGGPSNLADLAAMAASAPRGTGEPAVKPRMAAAGGVQRPFAAAAATASGPRPAAAPSMRAVEEPARAEAAAAPQSVAPVEAAEPVPLKQPAAEVAKAAEAPPAARSEPVAPPRPASPAPAPRPAEGGLSQTEKLLLEHIEYLRQQLDRRDKALEEKDELIADLARRLTKLGRNAVERLPPARLPAPGRSAGALIDPEVSERLDDIDQRLKQTMSSVSDVLSSLRNHLVERGPEGGG